MIQAPRPPGLSMSTGYTPTGMETRVAGLPNFDMAALEEALRRRQQERTEEMYAARNEARRAAAPETVNVASAPEQSRNEQIAGLEARMQRLQPTYVDLVTGGPGRLGGYMPTNRMNQSTVASGWV
jgi:hypothetical protein